VFFRFHTRCIQGDLDAACQMPGLEGLYVSWSGIKSLEPLSSNNDVHFLKIGSSPGIDDIGPLSRLRQLEWLELDNLKLIDDLSPISNLTRLEGFAFTGAEGKPILVKSFEPLSGLSELRWLHLAVTINPQLDLRPLATLKKLRWLGLANRFPMEEFAWLSFGLPNSASPWFRPGDDLGRLGINCKRCKSGLMLLSGKGKGKICPTCKSTKWVSHQLAFAKAAAT